MTEALDELVTELRHAADALDDLEVLAAAWRREAIFGAGRIQELERTLALVKGALDDTLRDVRDA